MLRTVFLLFTVCSFHASFCQVKTSAADTNLVPACCKKGKIINAVKWSDNTGENFCLPWKLVSMKLNLKAM